jgi:hypothetical protein
MGCEEELMRAREDLDELTVERDQLLVIVTALFDEVTELQFARVRARLAVQGVALPG